MQHEIHVDRAFGLGGEFAAVFADEVIADQFVGVGGEGCRISFYEWTKWT